MSNFNFAMTVVPKEDYTELKHENGLYVAHIIEGEQTPDNYLCAECITREEPQMEAVRSAYNTWKEKRLARALERAKTAKIAEITTYDNSEAVNSFTLNGASVWLDKATRVGLVNSTTICKEAGQETTTLWLNGTKLIIPCDTALQLLAALELYALDCFNVTAAHKAEVEALSTIEAVEAYDITNGYPEHLNMNV